MAFRDKFLISGCRDFVTSARCFNSLTRVTTSGGAMNVPGYPNTYCKDLLTDLFTLLFVVELTDQNESDIRYIYTKIYLLLYKQGGSFNMRQYIFIFSHRLFCYRLWLLFCLVKNLSIFFFGKTCTTFILRLALRQ